MPRREGKREEKPEGAGHRRRKAAMVPRREEKREEKTEGRGTGEEKRSWCPARRGREKKKLRERGTGGEKRSWCPAGRGREKKNPRKRGTGEEKQPWCPTRRRVKNFRCSKKQGAVWHPALFLFIVQILLTVLQKWYLHSAFSYHRSPLIRHRRSSGRYQEAVRPRFSEPFRSLS
ncbi:Uncharacterised protein [uncultured Clostridium sp.]|nr:Uncharacterised protein [uncultured Clostridium sp.]